MVAILGPNGQPINGTNGHKPRKELVEAMNGGSFVRRRRPASIDGSYEAARDTAEFSTYWSQADGLDADSANSRAVRAKLVKRSRYETANNGFVDGIHQTYATDVIGKGPKLRMTTASAELNAVVELAFTKWAKTIQLRRKLWCMCHAKTQDGEPFGILRNNPNIRGKIKLDLTLIETEQCQTPALPMGDDNYIDGIKFDEFGNPEWYDILKKHPGGTSQFSNVAEQVPARFVLHWFLMRRPGQHRAVPEFRSTLNVGAGSRRHREATLAAAETAADFAAMIHTSMPPNDEDQVTPLTTTEIQKRMMIALPAGYDVTQMRAEHPGVAYEEFHRSQIREQARPKSMPINKAMGDSSQHNFASGRLDHLTYYQQIDDVEREDCNGLVLDPLFDVWWTEAVLANGWDVTYSADPYEAGDHSWDWPKHAVENEEARAAARDKNLRNGSLSPEEAAIEDGVDFDEHVNSLARSYGKTPDEIRELMMQNNMYLAFQAQAGLQGQKPSEQSDDDLPPK